MPDAMGLGLYFVEGEGPKFERPVRSAADIAKLAVPDMETELRYVMDAVRLIRRELDGRVPLIGFSGSPWTLACYMVEGGGSDNFSKIKAMMLREPAALHRLLDGRHRRGDRLPVGAARRRRAGAAGVRHLGRRAGAAPVSRVLAALPAAHRARNCRAAKARAHAADPVRQGQRALPRGAGRQRRRRRRRRLADDAGARRAAAPAASVALQGNLDPATLYGSPDAIRARSAARARQLRDGKAAREATCSTSATACRPTWIRSTLPCWSTRCTNSAHAESGLAAACGLPARCKWRYPRPVRAARSGFACKPRRMFIRVLLADIGIHLA